MGKKPFFTILLLIGTILAIHWLFFKTSNVENLTAEEAPVQKIKTVIIEEASPKLETIIEKPKQIAKVKKASLADLAIERWKAQKALADARNKQCEAAVKSILPDDNLIDPEDPFFNNRENVLLKLKDVFEQALQRDEASQGYGQLQNLVMNDFISDPADAYNGLVFFDSICRSFKALNYVDTVLEAGSINEWNQSERSEVSNFILVKIEELAQNHFSPSNMGYMVSLFEGMIERGFLSSDYREDIHDFVQKVIDQEEIFLRGFDEKDVESAANNIAALKGYLNDNGRLGEELLDIIKNMRADIQTN